MSWINPQQTEPSKATEKHEWFTPAEASKEEKIKKFEQNSEK